MKTSKLFTAAMFLSIRPAGYFRKTVKNQRISKKAMPDFLKKEVAEIAPQIANRVIMMARGYGAERGVEITADFTRALHDADYRAEAFRATGPSAAKTSEAILRVYSEIDKTYDDIKTESLKKGA